MRILSVLLCLQLLLLCSGSFCHGSDEKISNVDVVGYGECAGCAEKNIKTSHAFSGLGVTIDCKAEKGHFERKGTGKLDEQGKFKVSVPQNIVKDDGTLKEDCYAQLHSASNTPCPAINGLESSKIVFVSKSGDKQILGLKENLKFSPEICVSAFLWPLTKFPLPHLKGFGHHIIPSPPTRRVKPLHPPTVAPPKPVYQSPPVAPPMPVYNPPVAPPAPKIKKPCPPKPPKKVLPPPVPIYKPPLPPSIPKKPCPPKPPKVELPPPIPKKPCPPKPPKVELPPPVPICKPPKPPKIECPPPVPICKPPKPPKIECPPPVPICKPPLPPSIHKKPCPPKPPKIELPPPVPICKPPLPLPIPKKPCPPKPPKVELPPPVPIYKPPLPPPVPIHKPIPPVPKKPCPPLPPKHFPHQKFGKRPPTPPLSSNP